MGVYIQNIEMPKSCDDCPHPTCTLWQSVNGGERNEKCPIVPVPPHGDLIDRKTAYDSLLDGMVMTGYQSRALDCISDFFVPTILMAEEGE